MALALSLGLLAGCGQQTPADDATGGDVSDQQEAGDDAQQTGDSDLQYVLDKGKLVIGVTVYEPMNYFDENGEWIGFDTELAEAVCEELGVEPEFVEIVWDTKEAELDARSIDCIWNGFTIDPEKEQALDYSMAYMKNAQVVVVKGDSITSLDQITGSVSAEMGSAGESAIQGDETLSALSYVGVTKQTDALVEVASGASEACVIDFVMADSMIGEGTSYEDLKVIAELNAEEYGIGFRSGSDITEKVNEILRDLWSQGVVQEIAERYGVSGNMIEENFAG